MVEILVKFPVNLHKSNSQSLRGLCDIVNGDYPAIVLRHDRQIVKENFPAGTILQLGNSVFDNYLLDDIAGELDAIPLWTQEKNKNKEPITRYCNDSVHEGSNPYFNIVDSIITVLSNSTFERDKTILKNISDPLNEAKKYLYRCILSNDGNIHIHGVIRDMRHDTAKDWYKANPLEFGEGFYIDVDMELNSDSNGYEGTRVRRHLSTEIYPRENMTLYHNDYFRIVRAGIIYAKDKKLHVSTDTLDDINAIVRNEKGLKISTIYEQYDTPLAKSVPEFSGIITPLYNGLMKGKESVRESGLKDARDIVERFFK